MKTGITLFLELMIILTLLLCGLVILQFGWICYATFTERPGMNGSLYEYYGMDRIVFGSSFLVVCLGALFISLRLLYFTYWLPNPARAKHTLLLFLLYAALLVAFEIFLSSQYVGKG